MEEQGIRIAQIRVRLSVGPLRLVSLAQCCSTLLTLSAIALYGLGVGVGEGFFTAAGVAICEGAGRFKTLGSVFFCSGADSSPAGAWIRDG